MGLAYYRFFPGDYQRDTRHLSMMQNGAYRLLIDEYMVHGPLPNDLQRLYRICSAFSKEEMGSVEYVLTEFFLLDRDCNLWRHKRCDVERNWQAGKSEAAKDAINKRWAYERNTDVLPTKNERNTNQNQNHIKSKATPRAPSDDGLGGGFEKFWVAYPKKRSKGDAQKAWRALKPDEQLQAQILAGLQRATTSAQWRKDDGQFIPHPATWLRARGWEDDLGPGPAADVTYLHGQARIGGFVP